MVIGRADWWRRHGMDVVYDVAPPAILLTLGLIDISTGTLSTPVGEAPPVTALIPGTIACLALLLRRRFPLVTLGVILLASIVPPLVLATSVTFWDSFAVILVALYSCARHRPLVWALVALACAALGLTALAIEFRDLRDPGGLVFYAFMMIGACALGLLARSWDGYRRRALRAAADRAVALERATQQERTRIARELHDVISHTITVIVMQAGGARLTAASDPTVALDALARIERLGRESLAELRALLHVLREDADEPGGTAPQPTLADVDELCAQMKALGLPVRTHVDGDTSRMAAGVQLTGYRIVQEGLTNVLKHAGAVDTEVRIIATTAALVVEVSCARGDRSAALGGTEHGLQGLRERVEVLGGNLSAGARLDGGYLLRAELPVTVEVS